MNALHMFEFSGINILMMDYRGYGKSTGIPDERGLNIDADTVLAYATNHPRFIYLIYFFFFILLSFLIILIL